MDSETEGKWTIDKNVENKETEDDGSLGKHLLRQKLNWLLKTSLSNAALIAPVNMLGRMYESGQKRLNKPGWLMSD